MLPMVPGSVLVPGLPATRRSEGGGRVVGMHIVVTGGSGKLGGAVVERLLASGHQVTNVNPGPLIQATFESPARTQVLALTGTNGAMRTYMTPDEQAVILRGGMLIGTRGLGRDLSVAEPGTEALIRAGQSGSGTRVMRYLSGDGLERPLQFSCTTAPGPNPGVILETCEGHGATFQNNYLVQNGQIPVSRQWIGPGMGYVTIQTLRP